MTTEKFTIAEQECIRVTGSLAQVKAATEKYFKQGYEMIPKTGRYFQNHECQFNSIALRPSRYKWAERDPKSK
jgi:hypothetical protein